MRALILSRILSAKKNNTPIKEEGIGCVIVADEGETEEQGE